METSAKFTAHSDVEDSLVNYGAVGMISVAAPQALNGKMCTGNDIFNSRIQKFVLNMRNIKGFPSENVGCDSKNMKINTSLSPQFYNQYLFFCVFSQNSLLVRI